MIDSLVVIKQLRTSWSNIVLGISRRKIFASSNAIMTNSFELFAHLYDLLEVSELRISWEFIISISPGLPVFDLPTHDQVDGGLLLFDSLSKIEIRMLSHALTSHKWEPVDRQFSSGLIFSFFLNPSFAVGIYETLWNISHFKITQPNIKRFHDWRASK